MGNYSKANVSQHLEFAFFVRRLTLAHFLSLGEFEMKKSLKIIALLLVTALSLTMIFGFPVSAASALIMVSPDTNVGVGQTITVTGKYIGDEELYAFVGSIAYDTSKVQYVSGGTNQGSAIHFAEALSGKKSVSVSATFKVIAKGNAYFKFTGNGSDGTQEFNAAAGVTLCCALIAAGEINDNVSWTLDNDGLLLIDGEGSVDDYKLPALAPWYAYREQITKVEISETITKIGNNAFSCLANLTDVIIHNPDLQFGLYPFSVDISPTIYGVSGGKVEEYATQNGYTFIDLSVPDTPAAPIIESCEKTTVTLAPTDGYEYSMDGELWQSSNVFYNIPQDEIVYFYQRVAATEYLPASSMSEATKCVSASPPKVWVGETIILVEPTDGFEYCLEDMIWGEDGKFIQYIIPEETYTVFGRFSNNHSPDIKVFYDKDGTTVNVNGRDPITEPVASDLIWLKKHLLTVTNSNNLGADVNSDRSVDILDLVRLKKNIAVTEDSFINPVSGFIWPVPGYNKVVSGYGYITDPITGKVRLHSGIDISDYDIYLKPVVAITDGNIFKSYTSCPHRSKKPICNCGGGYGNYVAIDHGMITIDGKQDQYTAYYAHMDSVEKSSGSVKQGQLLGYVGTTGSSTGYHLHFGLAKNGRYDGWVNPLDYF